VYIFWTVHYFVQCVIGLLGADLGVESARCPYKDCDVIIPHPKLVEVVERCKTELELLYPPIHSSLETELQLQLHLSSADKIINVVMLTGDSATFPFNSRTKITQLKKEIEKKLKVTPDKQQLIYNETVLEVGENEKAALVLFTSSYSARFMTLYYVNVSDSVVP
jgi:Ubiquitin family